jgi:hypothetical protein
VSDFYDPSTIEQELNPEYAKAKLRGFLTGLKMLPGAAAEVLPLTQDEQGNVSPALPGIVTGAYGGVGYGVPTIINKLAGTNLPAAPGAQSAAETFQGTLDLANRIVPVDKVIPAPQSEGERIAGDMMQAAGGMAVPIPAAAVAQVPTAVGRGIVHSLAPTTSSILPQMGIQAGATGVIEGYMSGQEKKNELDQLLNPPTEQPASGKPMSSADQPTTVAEAAQTAPVTSTAAQAQPADPNAQLDAILNGQPYKPPAPTFGEQGESGISVGQVLGGLAVLGGALVAGRYFHGIGRETTQAARDARMLAPKYAEAAQDFANNQVAKIGPTLTEPVQAPLPESGRVAHRVATAAKNNVLDESAHLQDYIHLTTDNPSTGTQLAHQAGMIENDMQWQGRMRQFLDTGVDYKSNIHMPTPTRLFDDIAALADADKTRLNHALLASNEMDNRLIMQQKGATPSRYDFPNQSDQDLARIVVDAQRDPVLRDIMDRYSTITRRMIDIGEQRKFFTAAEANDIKTQHPNHVPDVDDQGRILHAMGPRSLAPKGGVGQVNTNAWTALAQHLDALYHQYELNDFRRALKEHQLKVQTKPGSAQAIERVQLPAQPPTYYGTVQPMGSNIREPIVTIRDGAGPEHYRIYNNNMYNWFAASNATKMRAFMDAASAPRRWIQTGTTGVASLLTGRAFPITNTARTAFQMQINRPKGYAGGLMDLGMQRLTGGRLGYRGLDPTNVIGAAYSLGRGGLDDLALHLSHMFDKSNANLSTQILKSLITPARMDAISQALHDYHVNTRTFEMRAHGLGGQGTPFATNLPAFHTSTGESLRKTRLQAAQLSPKLFLSGGKLGSIKPAWINLRRAAEDIFQSISDSSHEYFYRLNRIAGKEPESLAYETRQLTGDPGTAGAGTVAQGIRGLVPYANVSMQGAARMGRALNETPIGTTAALVGSLGSAALLSIYTAMNHGQEAVDWLQNQLTSQGRAANVVLFGDKDKPPEAQWQFSLPQELRPMYALMTDIISKALNLDAAKHDADVHDGIWGFMKDWFSEHIENSTWESALHGVADAANVLDVPPMANAFVGLTDQSVRLDFERIVNDLRSGETGLTHTLTMPAGADRPLPNHPPGDDSVVGADGKKFVNIMSNLFGLVGGTTDHLLGFEKYYNQTNDFWSSLGGVGRDWLQHAKDLNPMLNNVLWENQVRDSVRPPIVESVQRQLDKMKSMSGGTNQQYEGTTGGGRAALPVTPQQPGRFAKLDPEMRPLYLAVDQEYKYLTSSSGPMGQIGALKKQMQDVSSKMMDKTEQREWMNNQTRLIADKYRYIQARIDDLNAAMSRRIGAPVNISNIDWDKGPDQFKSGQ